MEKAKIDLTQVIEKVQTISDGNEKTWIFPHNQFYWKYTDDRFWGSCHTFLIPEFEKKKSLQSVQFYMKGSVKFMVHSPGFFFSKRRRIILRITLRIILMKSIRLIIVCIKCWIIMIKNVRAKKIMTEIHVMIWPSLKSP